MLGVNVWRGVLGVDQATVIESTEKDEKRAVVARVRHRRDSKRLRGRCGARAPGNNRGEGRQRRRTLDLGTANASRSYCQSQPSRPNSRIPEKYRSCDRQESEGSRARNHRQSRGWSALGAPPPRLVP